jgi:nitric oxide synthase-interacting protein
MNDLLAQRKEIKRLEKEREKMTREQRETEDLMAEEARQRELKEFEMVTMGLEGRKRKQPGDESNNERNNNAMNDNKGDGSPGNGEAAKKRKREFSLNEEEMHRVAREERDRIMREMESEKVCSPEASNGDLQVLILRRTHLQSRSYPRSGSRL